MSFLQFNATKMLHTAHGPQLFDINFALQQGQTLAIHGPSGAGKTTILRILAGLTPADTGHIEVDGETWLDIQRHIDLPTRHRSIGFVFQDFALFPNLTVRGQLEYALPKSNSTKKAAKAAASVIDELLALTELETLQNRRPALLSGGQQQRVAIARAIARGPRLLLLDEPLSALDDEMRHKLQDYLLKIQQRYHLTTLLVSHDSKEISRLSNNVIHLEKGRIERHGTPDQVFIGKLHLTGIILDLTPAGETTKVRIDCEGKTIELTLPKAKAATLQPGRELSITIQQTPDS